MSGSGNESLRVGFVGSGFIADFHLQSLESVRHVDVVGVFSPTAEKRSAFAEKVRDLNLGECVAYDSLEALVCAPGVDAIWILSPNHTRIAAMATIAEAVKAGRSGVRAVACEKPLARTLAEAKELLSIVQDAGLLHGYLENQVFAPAIVRGRDIIWERAVPGTGRPYLARASEEHAGPHEGWFWDGSKQGGGVLTDMMCHSVEAARFLLTAPGEARDALTLVSANATVANLKWTRSKYSEQLRDSMDLDFDFRESPVEDFARGVLEFDDPDGNRVLVESSTSWSYVGPGLKIGLELHGPEYAMEFNSLQSRLNVFMSRRISGDEGEDMIEKQNAEQGLMPIAEDEASLYGYVAENRHMVERFRAGQQPDETFEDGVAVIEMLMALYKSAEEGRTIRLDDEDLTDFVPLAATQGSGRS